MARQVVYPFERFTEDAKKTLTLAQEEAERSHHSYIGTEHLLLGLLRLPEGPARDVLRELGVDIDTVRQTIASVIGRDERIIIQQIVPTSRVKMVIEIAFEEARRLGVTHVDSGLLLMALAVEGEGIAAHVLEDLGASAEKVVAAVERRAGAEASGRGKQPEPRRIPFPGRKQVQVGELRTLAGSRLPRPPESDVETLHRLLSTLDIAALLRRRGLDADALARELSRPPESVLTLRREIAVARGHVANAVAESDYERAAQTQRHVRKLIDRLQKAEADWLDKLGG